MFADGQFPVAWTDVHWLMTEASDSPNFALLHEADASAGRPSIEILHDTIKFGNLTLKKSKGDSAHFTPSEM